MTERSSGRTRIISIIWPENHLRFRQES